MKNYRNLCLVFFLFSCEKDKVTTPIVTNTPCVLNDTVSFQNEVFPLISNYCISCHSYSGSGGLNLDSYAGVQSFAVTGQLYPTLLHDPNGIIMPPLPAAGLDSCEVKLIKRWIDQGALNN
jgi:hypothetical protein